MPDVTLYIKIREVQMMLSMLARLWHNNMSQHLAEHTDGLSPLQYAVLRMSNENAMTLSEISRKLGVDPSTLVPVVDALEKRAYIERRRDTQDRRRFPLFVTEAGRQCVNAIPIMQDDDDFIKSMRLMGHDKIDDLGKLLRELIANTTDGDNALKEINDRIDIYRRSLDSDGTSQQNCMSIADDQ